jgi:hypothetical protein
LLFAGCKLPGHQGDAGPDLLGRHGHDKGKTPEEIRTTLKIGNDFTPDEEAELRRENQWAFE